MATDFVIETADTEKKAQIVSELTSILKGAGLQEVVPTAIVTTDFKGTVNRIIAEQSPEDYDPTREGGEAVGTCIPAIREGNIRITMVFDHRLFLLEKGNMLRIRIALHEAAHAVILKRKFDTDGQLWSRKRRTRVEFINDAVKRAWEEFCAERYSAECAASLATSSPEANKEAFLCSTFYADQILEYLQGLEEFLKEWTVSDFFSTQDPSIVWERVSTRIETLVRLLSYVYGVIGLSAGIDNRIKAIEDLDSFQAHFGEFWGSIVKEFLLLCDGDELLKDGPLESAAFQYGKILDTFGVVFEETREGLGVQVVALR